MAILCIKHARSGTEISLYRLSAEAEINLIPRLPNQQLWAIQVKRTIAPKVARGFHIPSDDLAMAGRILLYAELRQVPGQGGAGAACGKGDGAVVGASAPASRVLFANSVATLNSHF
ncbi:MAG: hypothetical protein AAGF53_16115 [Pseudomonadota bacterium]